MYILFLERISLTETCAIFRGQKKFSLTQWEKSPKRQSEGDRFYYVNSALKIQCHVVKNTLYRLIFRRFCSLGKWGRV